MEWVLNSNIKWQLKDLIFVEKAIDDWRWEDALTKTAILTQSLNYDDELWLIRASIVDFYADRIVYSDWAPVVKQSALWWLIDKYDSELAEKYWEVYDEAVAYKNNVLYNVSMDEINWLNDLAIVLHNLWEKSSSSKWTASSWVKLSSKLADMMGKLASSPSWWKWNGSTSSIKWAVVPIKWLSAMWYKPATLPKNGWLTVKTSTKALIYPSTKPKIIPNIFDGIPNIIVYFNTFSIKFVTAIKILRTIPNIKAKTKKAIAW